MSPCTLCPRECGVCRDAAPGYCGARELPSIARAALHFWEEPCISGTRGSGAIFFSGCNMNCVFCQNSGINHTLVGGETDAEGLAAIMLRLEGAGAHNVNLVSPAPFSAVAAEAIRRARDAGLTVPIVYNTNGYEKVGALRALSGLVNIYLPDLKYVTSGIAGKYSGTPDYFEFAAPALDEMFAQVGLIHKDADGMALGGLIIRHLVLPGSVDETRRVIDYIAARFPHEIDVSLMGQYAPNGAALPKPLQRKLLKREYERAIEYALEAGLGNVLAQSLSSATLDYTPEFDGKTV